MHPKSTGTEAPAPDRPRPRPMYFFTGRFVCLLIRAFNKLVNSPVPLSSMHCSSK